MVMEALEVDDNGKDQDGSKQIAQVWQVRAGKGLANSAEFIVAGGQEVEDGNDSSLKFGSVAEVDGRRTEGFPDNCFADVCCDK